MPKQSKSDANSLFMVKLVNEDYVSEHVGEAYASLMLNPAVTWAKFILTDDQPNDNRHRVPQTEFHNLIKSGLHMPVKMAYGKINEDHDDAFPLGVITHLKQEDNKVVALAALWTEERPSDVRYIKDKVAAKEPVNVSWEILFGDFTEEDGVVDLKDTSLKAATIVGIPAYAGRTPILAVAAKKWSKAYVTQLPDSAFLHVESREAVDEEGNTIQNITRQFPMRNSDGNLDAERAVTSIAEISASSLSDEKKTAYMEIANKLIKDASDNQTKPVEIEAGNINSEESTLDELNELKNKIAQLESELAAKVAEVTEAQEMLASRDEQLTELESLREFKANADAEKDEIEKLALVKTKFEEVGIAKEDAYFVDNKDFLLKVAADEDTLAFMLQELVSFKGDEPEDVEEDGEEDAEGQASKAKKIPNLQSNNQETLTIEALAKGLRERGKVK